MGLMFFFHRNFGFCEKNTAWEKRVWVCYVWVAVYRFAVFGSGKNAGVWVCCVWVAWRREVARQGRNGKTKGAFGLTKEW
jgi:hypothetical protein